MQLPNAKAAAGLLGCTCNAHGLQPAGRADSTDSWRLRSGVARLVHGDPYPSQPLAARTSGSRPTARPTFRGSPAAEKAPWGTPGQRKRDRRAGCTGDAGTPVSTERAVSSGHQQGPAGAGGREGDPGQIGRPCPSWFLSHPPPKQIPHLPLPGWQKRKPLGMWPPRPQRARAARTSFPRGEGTAGCSARSQIASPASSQRR